MRIAYGALKPCRSPRLLAFGGGIGGGKSTLRQLLLGQRSWHDFNRAALVDTDRIRLGLRGYGDIAPHDASALRQMHLKASALAEARLNRLLAAGVDIVWESTLGWEPDEDHAAGELELSYLRRFRARGYRVYLHGVTCDWARAAKRFQDRAERENRPVSDQARIAGSHRRFEDNIPRVARAVTAFWLWRNDASDFRVLADWKAGGAKVPATPRRISPRPVLETVAPKTENKPAF